MRKSVIKKRMLTATASVGVVLVSCVCYFFWPAVVATATGQGLIDNTPVAQRPADWAQPLEKAGLPNLYRITENLYRGAQPSKQGMAELKEMGIKTVVNLREHHDDNRKVATSGLQVVSIELSPRGVTDEQVIEFLRTVVDPGRMPVFFHCQHGADRTGTMAAAYRIVVQGWSKQRAIDEMARGGYGFHNEWQGLVDYLNAMDAQKIRRAVFSSEIAQSKPASQPVTLPATVR